MAVLPFWGYQLLFLHVLFFFVMLPPACIFLFVLPLTFHDSGFPEISGDLWFSFSLKVRGTYPQHTKLNYMKLPAFPAFSAVYEHPWLSDLHFYITFSTKRTRPHWKNGWFQSWGRECSRWIWDVLLCQKIRKCSKSMKSTQESAWRDSHWLSVGQLEHQSG